MRGNPINEYDNEYDILMEEMEDADKKNKLESYRKVNARVENILLKSYDRVEKLETLICTFEAKSTNDSYNANLALAYVVVSFIFGIFTNILNASDNKWLFFMVTFCLTTGALGLFSYTRKAHKTEQNRTFILNLLRFRYEEIKNEEALAQKTEHKESNKKRVHKT